VSEITAEKMKLSASIIILCLLYVNYVDVIFGDTIRKVNDDTDIIYVFSASC